MAAPPNLGKLIHPIPEGRNFPSPGGNPSQGQSAPSVDPVIFKVTLFWILLDILSVLIAAAVAVREWIGPFAGKGGAVHTVGMLAGGRMLSMIYLGWFIIALIVVSRRMHLYADIEARNTLHDMRLKYPGMLHGRAIAERRPVFCTRGGGFPRCRQPDDSSLTTILLVVRRLCWRYIVYRRYERGMETRNILVVGTGRVGQALRHHVEGIRHLGYTFKGYVQITGSDLDSNVKSADVLGNFDEVLELARLHFVDEILLVQFQLNLGW